MLVPYTFEPGETTVVITLVSVAEIRTEGFVLQCDVRLHCHAVVITLCINSFQGC